MEAWSRILMLSLGGVAGVNARYWLGVWMNRWTASHWATFAINTSGSFAIGFLSMALAHWLPHPHIRLAVLTGFLGGYTTFSTFAFESVTLWERGERGIAVLNLSGSVVAGFVAAFLGIALARDVLIPSRHPQTPSVRGSAAAAAAARDRLLAEDDEGSPDLELPPDFAALDLRRPSTDPAEPPPGREGMNP
ncbi:fluoride efflux transporter FluC [Paludisphaera soli]|uniref:fluoride efflux transporter FluC n=1 Tax=Paludisphaera soli TaxID=2712865 RepID=UPI0013ED3C38|nr:CrcB family protein [Paludisphaera soli]